jgi:hypothetical protein
LRNKLEFHGVLVGTLFKAYFTESRMKLHHLKQCRAVFLMQFDGFCKGLFFYDVCFFAFFDPSCVCLARQNLIIGDSRFAVRFNGASSTYLLQIKYVQKTNAEDDMDTPSHILDKR